MGGKNSFYFIFIKKLFLTSTDFLAGLHFHHHIAWSGLMRVDSCIGATGQYMTLYLVTNVLLYELLLTFSSMEKVECWCFR